MGIHEALELVLSSVYLVLQDIWKMRDLKERKGKGHENHVDEESIPEQPPAVQQAEEVVEEIEIEEVDEIPPGVELVPHEHVHVTFPSDDDDDETPEEPAPENLSTVTIEEIGIEVDVEETWFAVVDENPEVLINSYEACPRSQGGG